MSHWVWPRVAPVLELGKQRLNSEQLRPSPTWPDPDPLSPAQPRGPTGLVAQGGKRWGPTTPGSHHRVPLRPRASDPPPNIPLEGHGCQPRTKPEWRQAQGWSGAGWDRRPPLWGHQVPKTTSEKERGGEVLWEPCPRLGTGAWVCPAASMGTRSTGLKDSVGGRGQGHSARPQVPRRRAVLLLRHP